MVQSEMPAPGPLAPTHGPLTVEELQLAFRNRGMPLETMRYDLTPTGLHYLVIHFDIPVVEPASWRLPIGGHVRKPLEVTLDDVRSRPRTTIAVTLECAGNGRAWLSPRPLSIPWLGEAIGTAEWTGTPLAPLLEEAGIEPGALEVVFTGADRGIQGDVDQHYGRALTVENAMRPEVLVPGWYGMTSVKWLTSIDVVTESFAGYQQATTYRYKRDADDPGEPVSRLRVRALMIPPGFPDYFSRRRFVEQGSVRLSGRAWSGAGPVKRVEVGVDGEWADATLDAPVGDFAWRGWSFAWDATPGEHELACRATDAAGNVQPLEAPWNYLGMGNNVVQRLDVTVR
jgi:DMSO/TMAO reductase YedYZ molybdopterin-dependent catalytic subunit